MRVVRLINLEYNICETLVSITNHKGDGEMKRKLRGKLLSIVLSIVMLLACIPCGAVTVNAATPSVLYLKPNSNWIKDGARFAAYFFGNGEKFTARGNGPAGGNFGCDS